MKNLRWGRIRSWHAVLDPAFKATALCGRKVIATEERLPLDEKSCEVCLRAVARLIDEAIAGG
jgi:hypothetical protein